MAWQQVPNKDTEPRVQQLFVGAIPGNWYRAVRPSWRGALCLYMYNFMKKYIFLTIPALLLSGCGQPAYRPATINPSVSSNVPSLVQTESGQKQDDLDNNIECGEPGAGRYVVVPASQGGGAYCECNEGYEWNTNKAKCLPVSRGLTQETNKPPSVQEKCTDLAAIRNKLYQIYIPIDDLNELIEIELKTEQDSNMPTLAARHEFWRLIEKNKIDLGLVHEWGLCQVETIEGAQRLFWEDAAKSLNSGKATKSAERAEFEVTNLYMTPERIKNNDEIINKVAKNQPILIGQEYITLTGMDIEEALGNTNSLIMRINLLFQKP